MTSGRCLVDLVGRDAAGSESMKTFMIRVSIAWMLLCMLNYHALGEARILYISNQESMPLTELKKSRLKDTYLRRDKAYNADDMEELYHVMVKPSLRKEITLNAFKDTHQRTAKSIQTTLVEVCDCVDEKNRKICLLLSHFEIQNSDEKKVHLNRLEVGNYIGRRWYIVWTDHHASESCP